MSNKSPPYQYFHNLTKTKHENNSFFDKKITIELFQDDIQIIIIITDNGNGFEKFNNNIKDALNPYITTKKNGTGLGLSIVNKIVNDHNGKIEFKPITEGAEVKILFNLDDSRNTYS